MVAHHQHALAPIERAHRTLRLIPSSRKAFGVRRIAILVVFAFLCGQSTAQQVYAPQGYYNPQQGYYAPSPYYLQSMQRTSPYAYYPVSNPYGSYYRTSMSAPPNPYAYGANGYWFPPPRPVYVAPYVQPPPPPKPPALRWPAVETSFAKREAKALPAQTFEPPPPSFQDFMQAVEAKKSAPYCRTPNENGWVSLGYMVSFFKPMQFAAPVVTLGNANNALPGAIGQTGTSVLFGDTPVDPGGISGVRLEAGMFLDKENRFSAEWTGFMTVQNSQTFNYASNAAGSPVIARPFLDVTTNAENAFLISRPGQFSGNTTIDTQSMLASMEVNARAHAYWFQRLHADCLLGFRLARLTESFSVRDQLTPLQANQLTFNGAAVNSPNSLTDLDSFSTTNTFIGPQVGVRAAWEADRVSFDGFAKLALGVNRQQVAIAGETTLVTPTGNQTATGGVLAQQSNIGTYNRSTFSLLPEFGVGLGLDVTQHIRVRLGYSLLLWSQVVRPGNQIDHSINAGQAPGSPSFGTTGGVSSPAFRFSDELFWAHSFNLGLQIRF